MPRALNLLRRSIHYRRECFDAGLRAAGFELVDRVDRPAAGDLLLCWNRYGAAAEQADHFERHDARVLVVENCPLGNDLHGGSYAIARQHVAMTGGTWPDHGPQRWDAWGIELQPVRTGSAETVILGQRGIGHPDVASPDRWAESVQARIGGRIRSHPGTGVAVPLWQDLQDAREVVTWSSAAALQAMAMGVPVWHAHPRFVGAPAARPLAQHPGWSRREGGYRSTLHASMGEFAGNPPRDESARLAVFRRLAWAIWTLDEIRSGAAIRTVLGE